MNPPDRTDEETILVLERGNGATLRVRRNHFKGRDYIDVRVFIGEAPTQKGVSLRVDELAAVSAALADARRKDAQ